MRVHGTSGCSYSGCWLLMFALIAQKMHAQQDSVQYQPPTRLLLPRSSLRRHRAALHEPGATAIEIAVYGRMATGYCRRPDARRSAPRLLSMQPSDPTPSPTVIFCSRDVEITEHAISACHAPVFLPTPHSPAPPLPDKNLLALGAAGEHAGQVQSIVGRRRSY